MAKYEKLIFVKIGAWKSYDDLEENMSLPELMETVDEFYDADWREKKFLAGVQGIDLPDADDKLKQEVMERIAAKANAMLAGEDPDNEGAVEAKRFASMGIDYEVL